MTTTITFDIEPFEDDENLNPATVTKFLRQLNDLLSHGNDFPFRIGPAELLEVADDLPNLTMNTVEGELNLLILQGSWLPEEDVTVEVSNDVASAVIRGGDTKTLYRVTLARVPTCSTCGGPLELSDQYPEAGYLHSNDADDTHLPTRGNS